MPLPIKDEDLELITKKVYALYATHGFDGISMDEVSSQINISKATLYRYFTSKEDIVLGMVHFLNTHLDSVQFTVVERIDDVMGSIHEFYEKSILIAALSSSRFLTDLARKFPDAYAASRSAMDAMQQRFEKFYRTAVEKGFFRDLPFPFVSRQFAYMIPNIINVNYLEQNQITLSESIRQYYRMFLCQILGEDYLPLTEQEEIYDFVDDLTKVLQDDFLVDSVRR